VDEWHDAGQGQHAIGRIFGLTRAQRCGGLSRQEEATHKSLRQLIHALQSESVAHYWAMGIRVVRIDHAIRRQSNGTRRP
jgi:hypothetical protein